MRRSERTDGNPPQMFEELEKRVVLAADYAGVGMSWGAPFGQIRVLTFAEEGTVQNDLSVQGDYWVSGVQDRELDGPITYDRIELFNDGRFGRIPDNGLDEDPTETNGAQYLLQDGYRAGWWFGEYETGQEVEFLVQSPDNATVESFGGTWSYAAIGVDDFGVGFFNSSGRVAISGSNVNWLPELGVPIGSDERLEDVTEQGRAKSADDEYFYVNADGSVMVFSDMAEDDGFVFTGAAVKPGTDITPASVNGDYNLVWAIAGRGSGAGAIFLQRRLEIDANGDYKIYDLDEWDDGDRDELSRGFWSIQGGRLRLEDRDTNELTYFVIGEDGDNLLGVEGRPDSLSDALFGLATRAEPGSAGGNVILNTAAPNEFDREVLYELREQSGEDAWTGIELTRVAGGPNITGGTVTWIDPKDGMSYAAAVTDQGVVLYQSNGLGDWEFRNLTDEVFNGENIVGGLQVTTTPDELVHLTGLNSEGEVLHYFQNGTTVDGLGYGWAFQNISATQLTPNGIATPPFEGTLVSYSTSWGAINVIGLDSEGTLWSVWWAPGLANWQVSDLTSQFGSEPLVGGLTVYLTSWDGINIAGIHGSGDLLVTWWVPSFGGTWAQSNLTQEVNGPSLQPASVTSYVAPWGALNVAGIDETSGKVQVYWWVPENAETGWIVTTITDILPPNSPIIAGSLMGQTGLNGSLNLFGPVSGGSDLIRYYWEPDFGGAWMTQNVTEIATFL